MPDCPKAVKFQSSYQPHPCSECEWTGYTPNHHAYRPIRKYCTHKPPPDGLLLSNGCKMAVAQESWDLVVDEQSTCGYWLDREIGYRREEEREEERERALDAAAAAAGPAVGIVDEDMMDELLAALTDDEDEKEEEEEKEPRSIARFCRRLIRLNN